MLLTRAICLPTKRNRYLMKKLLYICLVILTACHTSEVEVDPGYAGYSYFPLEEGRFAIYDMEETTYSITADPVIKKYQVKEVIAQKYTDLSGQEAFLIHRFYRSGNQDLWKLEQDSVWTAKIETSRATRTENNITFVKLVFPLKQNTKWDGNRLNNYGKEEYILLDYKKPFQLLELPYDNTVTVSQSNTDDLCNKDVRYEVYADNIGLIYKESSILSYKQINNECPGDKNINYGVVFIQKLVEYGK